MTSDTESPPPCSRSDAMQLAIRTAVIAHLIVCVLTLALLATLDGPVGIAFGIGIAALLACAIPFIVLPAAAAIGYFSHLAFHKTTVPVAVLTRTLTLLFEASLFGWLVVLIVIARN